jgi:putative glutamine amidotransferase
VNTSKPRIAIPEPTSTDPEYNQRCFRQYEDAVTASGGTPVPILLNQDPSGIARQVATCSGILLPGSPADIDPGKYGEPVHPETAPRDILREACDELLLQDAFNLRKPLLGICYGHQSMNVWKGGTLTQHLTTGIDHAPGRTVEEAHAVRIAGDARLLQAAFNGSEAKVNSSHHQAVATPGDGLLPAAFAPEDGTLEAVEASEGFVVGVQWHPERTFSTKAASRKLFAEFVDAARGWHLRENGPNPAAETWQTTSKPPGSSKDGEAEQGPAAR